jgi:cytochrome P450
MHRDPRWWTDPERFDPTRWLSQNKPHARHAYLPFGAGPRICPGSLLATVQLTVLTALFARDYRLELPPLAEVPMTTDGLMLPAGLTGSWHALAD